ncbi:hypothetical protein HMPREF1981_02678 [Bacteroides pyogenes F0041]|uniref:Uncharacterized protein n=1 Tax=Bacteroides pyogenes F0041 TaxID=1321819 RepID=U2BVE8_9BACE|nr:hypothetical protein HMPREF1981_02678 [Bacteroides pyogenes F0041]
MEVNRDGGRFEKKSPEICIRRKRDLSENVEWQTAQGMYVHI